jgi:hypothetical protein
MKISSVLYTLNTSDNIPSEDDCQQGLMMEAASTSEISVNFYQTTWHNTEDSHLHT